MGRVVGRGGGRAKGDDEANRGCHTGEMEETRAIRCASSGRRGWCWTKIADVGVC